MRLDPHSYADVGQPRTRSIDLALRVDFSRRTLEGEIALHFHASGGGKVAGGVQTTPETGVAQVESWTLGTHQGANTLAAGSTGESPRPDPGPSARSAYSDR